MASVFGELRALLGIFGYLLGLRRQRAIFLERQQQLQDVLTEACANLAGIRRVWSEEHNRLNWRGWLHSELLSTREWSRNRAPLTTRLDRGPVVSPDVAAAIDGLYGEFDSAARGTQAFSSSWEKQLVDVLSALSEEMLSYRGRRLNRLIAFRSQLPELPELDRRIRTPQSAVEMQQRALAKLPVE